MSEPYEELIEGEWVLRLPPRRSHELICEFLHRVVGQAVQPMRTSQLVSCREKVKITDQHEFRPDLALLTTATGKLWLAAEVISQEDHHADTVLKKSIYEEIRLPRLWIIDPRYENVEVYHATQYGLALKETLMVKETLLETLLPGFVLPVKDLFSAPDRPTGLLGRDF